MISFNLPNPFLLGRIWEIERNHLLPSFQFGFVILVLGDNRLAGFGIMRNGLRIFLMLILRRIAHYFVVRVERYWRYLFCSVEIRHFILLFSGQPHKSCMTAQLRNQWHSKSKIGREEYARRKRHYLIGWLKLQRLHLPALFAHHQS